MDRLQIGGDGLAEAIAEIGIAAGRGFGPQRLGIAPGDVGKDEIGFERRRQLLDQLGAAGIGVGRGRGRRGGRGVRRRGLGGGKSAAGERGSDQQGDAAGHGNPSRRLRL